MQYTYSDNLNTIQEIYPGIYQIILDCATNKIIKILLNDNYKYIWIYNYEPKNNLNWVNHSLPISDKLQMNVLARNISYDLIINTEDFEKISSEIPKGVILLQINNLPPYFLNLQRLKGKSRYEMLKKECDFLFEIDIPGAVDYGTIISTNKLFLTDLLNDKRIDWTILP